MTDHAAPPPLDVLLARRDWVRRFARTLARDDASADDLEQDAWVATIEHPPRHVDAPVGWLRRVVSRRAIDVGAAGRRREARERIAARPEATPATDEVVAAAEAHRNVVEAVLALDEPYRTTVLLRFFEDLPPRDVAARMNVPVETVRSRVKRACDQLRDRLDDEHRGVRAAWLAPLLGVRFDGDAPSAPFPRASAAGWKTTFVVAAAGAAALIAVVLWNCSSAGTDARDVAAARPRNDKAAPLRREGRPRDGRGESIADAQEKPAAEDADAAKAATPPAPAEPDPKWPHAFFVTVVDDRRAPVAGVRVRIDPAEMKDELDAVTDESGRAKFQVVGAIRSARADPRAADGRAWRPVRRTVVVPPKTDGVELVVEPGAWIKGKVEHADGSPFAFAEVLALDSGRRVASTYADESGAYEMPVPVIGSWDVVVTGRSHQVFGTQNSPTGRITHVMDRAMGATDGEVRGVAPGSTGVALTARKPAGKATMRVRVVDGDGRPLAGVPIRVDDGGRALKPKPAVVADAEGRCTFDDVPDCRVAVTVAMGPDDPHPWTDAGWVPPVRGPLARPGDAEVVVEFLPGRTASGRVDLPADLKRRMNDGRAQAVGIDVFAGDEWVGRAWSDASDRFVVSVPKTPVRFAAWVWSDDGRRYDAAADESAASSDGLVLRLATSDPPPAPAKPSGIVPPK